jgi:single-strand DNA-binding protein
MFKGELIGNLGADAEVKESNGSKFVTMRVAHSESWKDESGERKERTTWVDVIMNDAESKLLPYLKQGVKIFVRGNLSLRVYSSPKDRMMKAGATINAWEIELLGGSNESVPKQIVDPADGRIYDVQKYYWINRDNKTMKKDETYTMVDARGNHFLMDKQGFVRPFVPEETKGE